MNKFADRVILVCYLIILMIATGVHIHVWRIEKEMDARYNLIFFNRTCRFIKPDPSKMLKRHFDICDIDPCDNVCYDPNKKY